MAVEYNEFIAQTTNRQTVLNILRAREREPMHFSSFSEVFGTVKGSVSPGINSVLNGDSGSTTATDTLLTNAGPTGALTGTAATDTLTRVANVGATNFTPSLGVAVTTGTDFKLAANAGDEFYKGILNPVPAATVVHYLRQGFPADLLSHLLIGRLDFYAQIVTTDTVTKKETAELVHLKTITNSPDEPISAVEFGTAIRCRELAYGVTKKETPALPVANLASLAPIPADMIKRLRAVKDNAGKVIGYELTTPSTNEFSLDLSAPKPGQCEQIRDMLTAAFGTETAKLGIPLTADAQVQAGPQLKALQGLSLFVGDRIAGAEREALRDPGAVKFSSVDYFRGLPQNKRGDLVIDLTLRSVQGVLYYLGEYVRRPDLSPKLFGQECGGYCLPVLRIEAADRIPRERRFLEVAYRGRRYGVPLAGADLSAESGRSSQTIDIVQQLLNLNRSSKDLPSTPLVRVAN